MDVNYECDVSTIQVDVLCYIYKNIYTYMIMMSVFVSQIYCAFVRKHNRMTVSQLILKELKLGGLESAQIDNFILIGEQGLNEFGFVNKRKKN